MNVQCLKAEDPTKTSCFPHICLKPSSVSDGNIFGVLKAGSLRNPLTMRSLQLTFHACATLSFHSPVLPPLFFLSLFFSDTSSLFLGYSNLLSSSSHSFFSSSIRFHYLLHRLFLWTLLFCFFCVLFSLDQ